MVMVMMLALMQACNQGLQSLMQGLFATAAPTPVRDRLPTNGLSKPWSVRPAPIPEPFHSPPGG
jgi:hypothetical protein